MNGAKPTLASPWSTEPAPTALTDPPRDVSDAQRQATRERDGMTGAVYTIEAPVICPHCETEVRSFRVLRLLRTQVSFTSTLPRKGYVIACPACARLLSAELSGLV